jgi:tetratricopeptide (TPR) repeat protein
MREPGAIHDLNARPLTYRKLMLAAAVGALLHGAPASAAPGDLSKFPINEDNPSANIPPVDARNAAPLEFGYFLQDLYTRGELAFQKGNWAIAVKYFEAIAKVIPDRARSFSKLCESYQHLDQQELAAKNCAKAIGLQGATLLDHKRFIETTLAGATLSPAAIGNLDASIAQVREHIAALPPEEPLPPPVAPKPVGPGVSAADAARSLAELKEAQLERRQAIATAKTRAMFMLEFETLACRLGLRVRDAPRLTRCLDELKRQKADERVLLPFDWSLALIVLDRPRATALLEQAKQLKLAPATLDAMVAEQNKTFGLLAWLKRSWLSVVLGFAAALGLAGAFFLVSRRRQPKAPTTPLDGARAPAES